MDVEDGIGMIKKASEKETEERMFMLYASRYPWMTEETFKTFNEFYSPQQHSEIQFKTESEILTDVKQILDSYQRGEN